jgi:hypothetical protein
LRKEAMDEIEAALKSCNGLLETSPAHMKQLSELTRGLRDRLTDTQINLRPTAARLSGSLLAIVDKLSQARLARLVFAALINSAMNDIKKPMRDASLDAIRTGIAASSLDGGGLNELSLEALVSAIVGEVNEAAIRVSLSNLDWVYVAVLSPEYFHVSQAGGLPDVLMLLHAVADSLPNLDEIVAARGQPLGEKYAVVLVECLTSSKSETRAAALSLLEASVENGVVNLESVRKASGRLKPAVQRTVGPLIAKIAKQTPSSLPIEKEPIPEKALAESQDNVVGREMRFPRAGKTTLAKVEHPSSVDPVPKHPLTSGKHLADSTTRSIIWPEYPEEPTGSILDNLKRFWSPYLPPTTTQALFPSSGIRKQDDAKNGIDLLSKALVIDRATGSAAVNEQLDLVLKWVCFVLCSKESTTGLLEILSLLRNLLQFMGESRREFSDSEALESVPLILDKVSGAKVRNVVDIQHRILVSLARTHLRLATLGEVSRRIPGNKSFTRTRRTLTTETSVFGMCTNDGQFSACEGEGPSVPLVCCMS